MDPDDESISPTERMKDHLNDELTRQIKTTVRYAMKQGFDESTIRRTVEQVLNEARVNA